VQPLAVHATYSLDNHDGLAKAQRFREASLWRVDPPEYFAGKFLVVNASISPALQVITIKICAVQAQMLRANNLLHSAIVVAAWLIV